MKTLSYIFTAFKDAFRWRFLIPCIILATLIGTIIFSNISPFLFGAFALLLLCLWLGYAVSMLRSYQIRGKFYPSLSCVQIWIGGKSLILAFIVAAIYVGIFALFHHPFSINQLYAHFLHRPSEGIGLLIGFLGLPFHYQFVTTLSLLQFFNLKKVFMIFTNHFLTFVGLFLQIICVAFLQLLTLAAIYIPLCLWLVHQGYNFFQEPLLLPLLLYQFIEYATALLILTLVIWYYFLFVMGSLVGQAFARIAQKEREKYETLHPVVHPEPISSFSRHYTIEEPGK